MLMMVTTTGMEMMDSAVLTTVPCTTWVSSLPKLRQNIVPNDATGMAMSRALMRFIWRLMPMRFQSMKSANGVTIRCRKVMM